MAGGGADGGVDLRLRQYGKAYIVQCKRWKTHQVGVSPVRELYGLMMAEKATGAFFVSSGSYTRDAKNFAKDNGLNLIDGLHLYELVRSTAGPSHKSEAANDLPLPERRCPVCGGAVIQRIAKRGKHLGEKFLGCAAYPKCTGVLASID